MLPTSVCRIDYFGELSKMTIRCPGYGHEVLATAVHASTRQSLFNQGFYWPSWGINLNYIELKRSSAIAIQNKDAPNSCFQPDGALAVKGTVLQFLAVEVRDSQSTRCTQQKAERYLLNTEGNIFYVVIIDLHRQENRGKRLEGHAAQAAPAAIRGMSAGYECSGIACKPPGGEDQNCPIGLDEKWMNIKTRPNRPHMAPAKRLNCRTVTRIIYPPLVLIRQ